MNRRDMIKLSAAGMSTLSLPALFSNALASQKNSNKKLVWVLLRGGMDSLHTVIPLFDRHLLSLRKDLITPIKDSALPISRGFALHPDLKFVHQLYEKKQLSTVVATATPYRERSHFSGQDFLESGLTSADPDNGWLARLIAQQNALTPTQGLAIARTLPVSLRGGSHTHTWYPSNLKNTSADLHNRLLKLYEYDEALSSRLEQALETQALLGDMKETKKPGKFTELAQSCAKLLAEPNGPDVAMLEMDGWDTHNRLIKRLSNNFKELDNGIKALHDGLAEQWDDTLVIVATEFGRTAAINGTGGTDHGTASAMFFAGGAISNNNQIVGGNVLGDWPGLSDSSLYEGRDLKATSNVFDWIASATQSHFNHNPQQRKEIFPS